MEDSTRHRQMLQTAMAQGVVEVADLCEVVGLHAVALLTVVEE
jgi:hypothetical protein